MTIKIVSVKIKTKYDWRNVSEMYDWSTVKNTSNIWQQLMQTSIVGEEIGIEVDLIESSWEGIKDNFSNWQEIKNRFTDWSDLKNW